MCTSLNRVQYTIRYVRCMECAIHKREKESASIIDLVVLTQTTALKKLQGAQNSAVRLDTCIKRDQNIDDARKKLHWLPIQDRVAFKLLLNTYKIQHGIAPYYLAELLTSV